MHKLIMISLTAFLVSCGTLKRIDTRIPDYLNQNDSRLKYEISKISWGEDSDFSDKIGYYTLQIEIQNTSEAYEPAGYRIIEKPERKISASEVLAISKDPRYTSRPEYWQYISGELNEQRICEIEIQLLFTAITSFPVQKKMFRIEVNEQYAGPMGWSICNVTFNKEKRLCYKYAVK